MNVTDVLVDSPNGYRITADEPEVVDEAIRYYLVQLERYPVEEYPVECAVANYGMGKLLFGDNTKPKVSEERAKRIENALYHLNQSLHVFNSSDYPTMFGLISIMMARLFRERATLISNRSFLADRSSPEDSVMYGVDQILEAFPIFFRSKSHMIEHALCSLEAGWLYLLQAEFLENFKDDSIREQAAMYLERAISLVHTIAEKGDKHVYTYPGDKQRRWNPILSAKSDYPEHVRLLLEQQPFSYIEGSALYLLGRLYQGWTELNAPVYAGVKGNHDRGRHLSGPSAAESFELQNQIKAFDYFTQAVRPKYLSKDCFLWADAHHRAAVTLIKYPKVVNPDYVEHSADEGASDIHLEVAISHLVLALRCPALTGPAAMDLHFHLAQTAISRLQMIIDRVPMGQSVTKALQAHSEGMDLIQTVEEHLEEARKRVTPASTQTTQDGYLYFFSCLKISEFRMLEAACKPQLLPIERENYLIDAVEHLIDALQARTLNDNTDLHYVATVQMSQLLLAAKRSYTAAKSYAKCLFTLSLIINRSLYNPEDVQEKLSEETVRNVGQSLAAGARDVPWVKLHFGPVSLNERLTAGYASWSFEDVPRVKISQDSSSALLDLSAEDISTYKVGPAAVPGFGDGRSVASGSAAPIYKASPPKGVPPLKLPVLDNKKVYVTGEVMHSGPGIASEEGPPGSGLKKKPPPPAGAIPLFALGHNPQYDSVGRGKKMHGADLHDASAPAQNYFLGPYGRRMRRRIPPTKQMFDIDRNNLQTFGFRNGKASFLLPGNIRKRADNIGKKGLVKGSASAGIGAKNRAAPTTSSQFSKPKALAGKAGASVVSSLAASQHGPAASGDGDSQEGEDDAEDGEDGDDDGSAGEDNDEGSAGDEEDGDVAGTRGRSKSIRPSRGGPPPAVSPSPGKMQPAMRKRRGVISWLFGAKKEKGPAPPAVSAPKPGFSLFRMFGGAQKKKQKDEEDEEEREVDMWASTQCFYTYNVLSRQSRMQLVLRCSKLEALDGERTNSQLFSTKPKYLNTYYSLKKLLSKDCAKLVVPPVSMKDLAARPFLEVQLLFSSQVRICRKLDDLEHLLYNKISKYDNFLPFITCAPVFTRDLADLDKALLNAETLTMNLANESTLMAYNAEKKKRQGHKEAAPPAGQQTADAAAQSQFAYDSVSSAHTSKGNSVAAADHSSAAVQKQRSEEAEDVAVGKVTLSLSQCLDGSNYLIGGQQGSRDMLASYVAQDECLMVWHLPVVPSQPIQVVLVWRDNSASLHDTFSSSAPPLIDMDAIAGKSKTKGAGGKKKRTVAEAEEEAARKNRAKGLVMEIAKSDIDTSHVLQYIQGYLDALHAQSTPVRATMTSDALRALSCALSLTEFLHMIPPHVKSLVICCPAPLRIIPWHLLLIEQSNAVPFSGSLASEKTVGDGSSPAPAAPGSSKPAEMHLLERFCVRLGPSLALFELNETGARALRHSAGLHRLCAVDGEADGADRSAGVRGTDLEVACVSTLWSADPGDYRVLSNDGAVPRAVQTVLFGETNNDEDYKKFKQAIFMKRRERHDYDKREVKGDFVSTLEAEHTMSKSEKRKARLRGGEGSGKDGAEQAADGEAGKNGEQEGGGEGGDGSGTDSEEDEEDDEEDAAGGGENDVAGKSGKKRRLKLTASHQDKKALTMCRVLHFSASKVPLTEGTEAGEKKEKIFARVSLPRYDRLETFRDPKYKAKLLHRNREEREDDARDSLSARDVVRQVFVRNCALCIMSRYALTDDVPDIRSPSGWSACDTNCEFIEALHLAGAKTVLHPLWSGRATGLAALAHLVFQIRFYSTLPANSKSRLAVVDTCRAAQLWLRDASADAIIAFIHKAPLPKNARKLVIAELESFVSASLTPAQQQLKLEAMKRVEAAGSLAAPSKFISPEKAAAGPSQSVAEGASQSVYVVGENGEAVGNRIGGTVKFFNHFMYWGSFAISGAGGGVHHPDLTENKNEGFEQGHISWNDEELNNMSFEASMLRMEGKTSEARELEKLIRQLRIDRIKKRIAAAKATGARAGRGLMDTLDYLDKALLDQDSDDVSVSDDSVELRRKRKQKKENKARESDSDEYDDDDELAEDASSRGGAKQQPSASKAEAAGSPAPGNSPAPAAPTPSKKFVPRALELGSMKPEDIAYEKWKSKVGGLNMNVRDPVLQQRKPAPDSKAADSYEYNMLNKVKSAADKEDKQEDYDARMEALYQKKEASKARRLAKASKGAEDSDDDEDEEGDGDDEEDGDSDADDDHSAAARKAVRRKQMRNADRDSESEYEASEDEEEDEPDSDEEGAGLYAQRKKLRKKKELKKQGKHKKASRFTTALKEVRGGVRSYSSVVKSITNKVPDKAKAKELLLASLARAGGGGENAEGSEQDEGRCAVS